MLLFKTNYGYKLKILFTLRQVKKISKTSKRENGEAYTATLKSLWISKVSIKIYKKVLQLKSI